MTEIKQVRLSGFGGQGIVMAGLLLGQAAAMEGKFVSGSNSYGAQARGSECRSEIVLSDRPIDFPHLLIADYLIAMSQGTYDLYSLELKEGGLILYDEGLVAPRNHKGWIQAGIPATEYSVQKMRNKQIANIVLLGAFIMITKLVTPGALRKAIRLHIQERFQDLNLKAFQSGMALGRRWNG